MYKKEKMFHVKRFVWNNRKSSDIIEPAIDVYRINLKTVARKLKLYRKIQMKRTGRSTVMGRAIAIANQKGGVGKSTTAINLSSCLGAMGQKVLTIDLDPQGNTTSGLGVEKDAAENTVYELLLGECEVEECLQKLEFEGVSLIPSNCQFSGSGD